MYLVVNFITEIVVVGAGRSNEVLLFFIKTATGLPAQVQQIHFHGINSRVWERDCRPTSPTPPGPAARNVIKYRIRDPSSA